MDAEGKRRIEDEREGKKEKGKMKEEGRMWKRGKGGGRRELGSGIGDDGYLAIEFVQHDKHCLF